jgi:hypothetical protein
VSNIILSTYAWATSLRSSAAYALQERMADMKPESGQDLVEYAIIIGGVAALAGAAYFALPGDLFTGFTDVIEACITFDGAGCTP